MDQFDIIGALEAYALSKGWTFVYKFNDEYGNINIQQEYAAGEIVLTVDSLDQPTIANGRVTGVIYTCLLMLGRKFDPDGEVCSLDETDKQKYDRRLKDLKTLLGSGIAEFACNNELEVAAGQMSFELNKFDTNIDFVLSTNVFTQ